MKAGTQPNNNRCCALPLCNLVDDLRVCSRCKVTYYCGKDHQRRDWKTHKNICTFNADGQAVLPSASPPNSVSWLPKKANNNCNPDSGRQNDLVKHILETMTDPFGKKRSLDKGDESYVDLAHLDISQKASSASGSSEPSDNTRVQQDNLSDHILRSHSYPLTPLKDEEEEAKERTAGAGHARSEWEVGGSEPVMPSGPSRYPPGKVGFKKQSKEWHEKFTHYLVECMNRFGICVVDRVLGEEKGDMVLQEVQALHQEGLFSDGQLVRTKKDTPIDKGAIRGDKIMWTDGVTPPSKNIHYLISLMDTIIQMTNGQFANINIISRTKVRLEWK